METLPELRTEIEKCNRCGYCQETCPVYAATGVESSVARGRIALVRAVVEGRLDLSPEMENALFECLLCRGCVPVCAPGAETDRIVAAARALWYERYGSGIGWRVARDLLLDRNALASVARLGFAASRLGLPAVAKATGILRLFPPAFRAAAELAPEPPRSFLTDRLADLRLEPDLGASLRVGYFVSCGMNLVQADAATDTIASLVELGCSVSVLDNCCCGLPAFVSGDHEAAQACALKNLAALGAEDDFDVIVTECASCSSHLRHLPELVPPELFAQAEAVCARIRDYSELVLERPWPGDLMRQDVRVTYHAPCHISRHQDLAAAPLEILNRLPGVTLVPMREADWCCGGAGTYTISHSEIGENILGRKMNHAAQTGAELLVTSCPACMVQLDHGCRTRGLDLRVVHLASLVAGALGVGG